MLLIKNNIDDESIIGIASSLEKARQCIKDYLIYTYAKKAEEFSFSVEGVGVINCNIFDYKLSSGDEFIIKYLVNATVASINISGVCPMTYPEKFIISVVDEDILYGYDYSPLVFVNECMEKKFWEIEDNDEEEL